MGGTTDTQAAIKWSDIEIPDGLNTRSDLPKIEQLAKAMKDQGQLTPIVVRKMPEGSKRPYLLVAGRRRMAAFSANKWTSREILAVVREYAANDALGPIVDNWAENEEREQIDTLDNAERVHQLLSGTYFVMPGQEAVPLTAERIAGLLNTTVRTVQKLAKVHRDVDPDVAIAARKAGAPSWLVIKLSQIAGEGDTREEREEKRAKGQFAILNSYVETKKALEAAGRQRAPREEKKKKPKKKAVEETEWYAINPDLGLDKKERNAAQYFDLLSKKIQRTKDETVKAQASGARDMMRLLSGEVSRLSFITEADWSELCPEPVEEEEEKEDEAAEE